MDLINRENIFWSKLFIIIFPMLIFVGVFYSVDSVNSMVSGTRGEYNKNSSKIMFTNYASPVAEKSIFVSQDAKNLISRNFAIYESSFDASSIIALNKDTGQVLYEKNAHTPRPIASITKLMVAILATERLNLDSNITISRNARFIPGKKTDLYWGSTLKLDEALHGLLIESGNDMAIAIEEYYNRVFPESSLVYDMNQKAYSMGLTETRFADSTGLSSQNVSTAYEVSKLLDKASENRIIREIMGKKEYEYNDRVWKNTNTLIGNKYGVIGGKTGYIPEAGNTMSVLGRIGDKEVLLVLLNISTDRIKESSEFFDWVRVAYKW